MCKRNDIMDVNKFLYTVAIVFSGVIKSLKFNFPSLQMIQRFPVLNRILFSIEFSNAEKLFPPQLTKPLNLLVKFSVFTKLPVWH